MMQRKAKIILITATIVFALLIAPGIFVAMMSVMMFDAPGSEKNKMIIILYTFISSFPVISFLSFSSWIFYAFKKYGLAIFISLIPLLNFIGILILLALSSII